MAELPPALTSLHCLAFEWLDTLDHVQSGYLGRRSGQSLGQPDPALRIRKDKTFALLVERKFRGKPPIDALRVHDEGCGTSAACSDKDIVSIAARIQVDDSVVDG